MMWQNIWTPSLYLTLDPLLTNIFHSLTVCNWIHFAVFYISQQHAAQMEQKQNETENKKVHGDVVKYGSVIQVRNIVFLLAHCPVTNLNLHVLLDSQIYVYLEQFSQTWEPLSYLDYNIQILNNI